MFNIKKCKKAKCLYFTENKKCEKCKKCQYNKIKKWRKNNG